MKRLVILGAGTAGTMVAAKLRPRLSTDEWTITMIDQSPTHYYQPGVPVHPLRDLHTR